MQGMLYEHITGGLNHVWDIRKGSSEKDELEVKNFPDRKKRKLNDPMMRSAP